MTGEPDVLDEQIISARGPHKRLRRWLRGAHPHLGKITRGLTGVETVQEIDIVVPTHVVMVLPPPQ